MNILERLTRAEFSWFDLVFVVVAFTLTRDLTTGPLQTLCFVAIGAVVGGVQAFLRPRILRRRRQPS